MFIALFSQTALPFLARIRPSASPYILIASFGLLLVAVLLNKRTIAFIAMAAGVALNLIVVAANGGMPVLAHAMPVAATDQIHIRMTAATRLTWLADIIAVPGPVNMLISPGDILLGAGVFILLFQGMMYKGRRRIKTAP